MSRTKRPWTKLSLAAVILLNLAAGSAAQAQRLRLATLAPQGTVWDKGLRSMGDQWAKATDGRVRLTVLLGSSYGDEHALLTRVRSGQLQGVALSSIGLLELDPAFGVFQIPLLFESDAEFRFVLAELRPMLEQRLKERKFVLLQWGYAGWVHLFSKAPIHTLEDLKRQKLFVSAGDDASVQSWKRNGYQPQPVTADQIPLGLQTGLLEVVPTTPLLVLSMQLYSQAGYMLALEIAPLMGAVLVSQQAWDAIAPADREALRRAAAETEAFLEREVPGQDASAIDTMKTKGLKVVELGPAEIPRWRHEADEFVRASIASSTPKEVIDAALAAVQKYRARREPAR